MNLNQSKRIIYLLKSMLATQGEWVVFLEMLWDVIFVYIKEKDCFILIYVY